ncbi:MAG: hypothetical protein PQJ60_13850, partial [Spirochaetales bacterium]|nr:hypothetical protein [Spirochaetales bacterium]
GRRRDDRRILFIRKPLGTNIAHRQERKQSLTEVFENLEIITALNVGAKVVLWFGLRERDGRGNRPPTPGGSRKSGGD